MIMLAISFCLFLSIGLYFDNVLPSAYGLRKSPLFCCSRRFCCGVPRRSGKTTPRKNIQEDPESEAFFETKYMPRGNFEPVSRELIKLE